MGDVTRERILDAASLIMRDNGVNAITMEAAADAAGVSRKTVYNHFSHKFDLIDSVVARGVERVIAELDVIACDPSLDFIEKLNRIMESGFERIRSGKRMFVRPSRMSENPAIPDVYLEIRNNLLRFIGGIVSDASRAGLIRPDVDARKLTLILITIVEGLILNDEAATEPFSRLEILKESLKSMLFGIMTESGIEAMRGSPIFRAEPEA